MPPITPTITGSTGEPMHASTHHSWRAQLHAERQRLDYMLRTIETDLRKLLAERRTLLQRRTELEKMTRLVVVPKTSGNCSQPSSTKNENLVRRRVFTPEALDQVALWTSQGVSRDEIAARLGTTMASLQVACSKAGVSLRRENGTYSRKPPGPRGSTNRSDPMPG